MGEAMAIKVGGVGQQVGALQAEAIRAPLPQVFNKALRLSRVGNRQGVVMGPEPTEGGVEALQHLRYCSIKIDQQMHGASRAQAKLLSSMMERHHLDLLHNQNPRPQKRKTCLSC